MAPFVIYDLHDLTDKQWEIIEPLLAKPKRWRNRRGRPSCDVLNGIL
ncbi:MAG: transposase [Proteobacteria bacterium]|nr:transposase [Pseudomonadota bacterium]